MKYLAGLFDLIDGNFKKQLSMYSVMRVYVAKAPGEVSATIAVLELCCRN